MTGQVVYVATARKIRLTEVESTLEGNMDVRGCLGLSEEVRNGFTSYGHALWWTGMLVASIGTDFWPRTTEGRMLAMLLSLYGLAVFGYITATLASYFIGRDADESSGPVAGSDDLKRLLKEVRELRLQLSESGISERQGPMGA